MRILKTFLVLLALACPIAAMAQLTLVGVGCSVLCGTTFSFAPVANAALSTQYSANSPVGGLTSTQTASITASSGGSGYQVSADGVTYGSTASIAPGGTIYVQLTSSASNSTLASMTVSLGGGRAAFNVTTVAAAGMVTAIFSPGQPTGPSNSAANFAPLVMAGAGSAWSTIATARIISMPIAGTFSALIANFTTVSAGSWALSLDVNGSASTLTCSLSSGTVCSGGATTVHVNVGDTIRWRTTPTGTPTAQTNIPIGAAFTSDIGGQGFIFNGYTAASFSTSVFNYVSFVPQLTPNATEANVSAVVPTAGVIDQLYVISGIAAGAAKSWTVTLMHNGVETSLQTTISGSSQTTNNDTNAGHAVTVAANDTISIEVCPGTVLAGVCTATTPTATAMQISARWAPTTAGEAIVFAVPQAFPTGNLAEYGDFSATSGLGPTGPNHQSLVSIPSTVKKFYFNQSTVPGGAASRVMTLRANAASPSGGPTCTTTAAQNSCNDTTHTYSASAGDLLDWLVQGSGSPAANTYMRLGAVVTSP